MVNIDKNQLYEVFRRKLIDEKLILCNDTINVREIHPFKYNGDIICHHIITVEQNQKKYFVRTIKEKDYSCLVASYLNSLNDISKRILFPCAITSPFTICNQSYVFTTYLEGEDLESQNEKLSSKELLEISNRIDNNLNIVHSVSSEKYSNGKQFVDNAFSEIMFYNIYMQFYNQYNIFAKNVDVDKLLVTVNSILTQSHFSKPTLVHMDIKPANIILSPQKDVYLIDFELSRFADLDYEWTNLLIKMLHSYDERFKRYVLTPIIEKNFMPLEKAILVDKYKVYLLYLAINKYLYCLKNGILCPRAIIDFSYQIINQLV